MKLKPVIIEVIKLSVIYIAAWLLLRLLLPPTNSRGMLDINLHDTYFVIAMPALTIRVFLLLTNLLYLIWEGFYRYKRTLQNVVLLVANFLFIIKLFFLATFVFRLPEPAGSGWTVYPPLSRLGQTQPKPPKTLEEYAIIVSLIKQITPIIFIVFMLILVITAILTGKNWNLTKNEQTSA
jgi:heme/copper-type cytochrome/quinol oxidase subunit 1